MDSMTLYVTSSCNLACEECIMAHLMAATKQYQMSLGELQEFIGLSERCNYKFNFELTGGEPLLWKNLKQGLQLLKASKICGNILIFTNAMSISKLDDEIMDCIDQLRVSEYTSNKKNIQTLKRKWPEKLRVVNRENFWKNPAWRVPNALPAECLNPEPMYMDRKIYGCPHSASIANAHDSQTKLSVPLQDNFLDHIKQLRAGQETTICACCISNNKVRQKVTRFTKKDVSDAPSFPADASISYL